MPAKVSRIQRKNKQGEVTAQFDYVKVAERIKEFHEKHINGRIDTELISAQGADMVVFKAIVTPDVTKPERYFTGHSQAKWSDTSNFVNFGAALENAETSSVGRALAMMNIGVIDTIASSNEINKMPPRPTYAPATSKPSYNPTGTSAPVNGDEPTQPQLTLIAGLSRTLNVTPKEVKTRKEASDEITRLKSMQNPA